MPNTAGQFQESELLPAYAEITNELASEQPDIAALISKYIPTLSSGTDAEKKAGLQSLRHKIIEDAKKVMVVAAAYGESSAAAAINKVKETPVVSPIIEDLDEQPEPEPVAYNASGKSLPDIHRELGSKEEVRRKLPPALSKQAALALTRRGTSRELTKQELEEALADLSREPESRVSELASRYTISATINAVKAFKSAVEEDLYCFEFMCSVWNTATPQSAVEAIYARAQQQSQQKNE